MVKLGFTRSILLLFAANCGDWAAVSSPASVFWVQECSLSQSLRCFRERWKQDLTTCSSTGDSVVFG